MRMMLIDRFLTEVKTLPQMFYNTVENFRERPALKYKVDGNYVTLDYDGFADVVETMGSGLLSLGLQSGDRVCLMANTSERWAWADFAIMTSGGVTVTVYPSLAREETAYIVNHGEARFLFAGNDEIVEKVKSVWDQMPTLEKVIVLDRDFTMDEEHILGLERLKEAGKKLLNDDPQVHRRAWEALKGEDPCSLTYTSGTTGDLKGSLFTHKDLIGALGRSLKHMIVGGYRATYNDIAFSLLPLAHIWERNNSYLAMIAVGACIGYAEKPSTLIQDIQSVKPTWALLVPRLWDRIYSGFKGAFTSSPEGKRLFEWAVRIGEKVLEHRTGSNGAIDLTADPTIGLDEKLKADFEKADELVYSQLRQFLGGRLSIPYSGGGMLSADLHRNYLILNFPLLNGWGLTETAAGINHGYPNATKIGWLSKMVPGVEGKIASDGEILVKGVGIIREYYKNPEETALSFIEDGWFCTGDIGEFDDEGFLKIVDRKKHIIVLDTGKKVAPARIETQFINSPFVEQVLVLGHDCKFVSALIVPAFDLILYMMKEKGFYVDERRLVYADMHGVTSCIEVGEEVTKNPFLIGLIEAEVKRINEYLNDYEQIKKFKLLPRKFMEERGEVTPTMKVKNRVLYEHYKDEIAAIYE
ncbi:MAG: long-chain fatty acid--CoA ligase [Bacillota bacterium]|nr:long-chain fatty acid--CoA ligase [Bacillota bacterium]